EGVAARDAQVEGVGGVGADLHLAPGVQPIGRVVGGEEVDAADQAEVEDVDVERLARTGVELEGELLPLDEARQGVARAPPPPRGALRRRVQSTASRSRERGFWSASATS